VVLFVALVISVLKLNDNLTQDERMGQKNTSRLVISLLYYDLFH